MRRIWRAFTTVFTLVGVVAIIAGAVLVKAGRISVEARGESAGDHATPPPPPAKMAAPSPASMPELSAEEARSWIHRLEELREELAERERDLAAREQILRKEKGDLRPAATALAELLGAVLPGKALTPDELLTKPEAVSELTEALRLELTHTKRVPALLATIREMAEEDAVVLLGQSLSADLATAILKAMDAETRGSILGALVRKDPSRAGQIFTRLAGESAGTTEAKDGEEGKG